MWSVCNVLCARASKEYIPRVGICIAVQMNRQTAFASEFGLGKAARQRSSQNHARRVVNWFRRVRPVRVYAFGRAAVS